MNRAHFSHPQTGYFRRPIADPPPRPAEAPRADGSHAEAEAETEAPFLAAVEAVLLDGEPLAALDGAALEAAGADAAGADAEGGLLDEIPSAYEAIFSADDVAGPEAGAAADDTPPMGVAADPLAATTPLAGAAEASAPAPIASPAPGIPSAFIAPDPSGPATAEEENVSRMEVPTPITPPASASPDHLPVAPPDVLAPHAIEAAASPDASPVADDHGAEAAEERPRSRVVGLLGGTARIRVVGVGGAGCNSVEGMLRMGLSGVDFLVMNTDAQALAASSCERRLQIGAGLTNGLGAGADPEIGRAAAEESAEDIAEFLQGADMLFITAGMGGGTGTGAAPVVARIAREMGILSAAVCTKPFRFEGARRMQRADDGLRELEDAADTMIVVANDKLLASAGAKMPLREAFAVANMVLGHSVSAISDIVNITGLVNVDFADVRAIMRDSGDAIIGIGRAKGEQRALNAVRKACSSPLLESLVIDGAGGILISIVGGNDLTLHEVSEAVGMVSNAASPQADIIFGAAIDERLGEEVKATVLATRFDRSRPGAVAEAALAAASLAASHAPTNAQGTLRDELAGVGIAAAATPDLPTHAEEEEALERLFGMPFDPAAAGVGATRANGHANGRHDEPGATSAERLGLTDDGSDDDHDLPAYLRRRRRRRFF